VPDKHKSSSASRQDWQEKAIHDLIQFANSGPFRAAGSYWAQRWGVSRRSADRVIHGLINSGVLEVVEKGSRDHPRILALIGGKNAGEQSHVAHKVILGSYSSKGSNYELPLGGCGHSDEIPPQPDPGCFASDSYRSEFDRGGMSSPTYGGQNPTRGKPDPLNDTGGDKVGSIARRIADIWGLHSKWAEQRSAEWDRSLRQFDPRLVDQLIDKLILTGADRPTLPQLIRMCASADRQRTPQTPSQKGQIVYTHQIAGKTANYLDLETWKDALVSLRSDGYSFEVDLWLRNLSIEISSGTLWIDVSDHSPESRDLTIRVLTKGSALYKNEGLSSSIPLSVPFTLPVLKDRLGGLSVGIKTRGVGWVTAEGHQGAPPNAPPKP